MQGERVVAGLSAGRRGFDIFLGGLLGLEVALVAWYFAGLRRGAAADVWYGMELFGWLATWAMGWLASRGPLEEVGAWSKV